MDQRISPPRLLTAVPFPWIRLRSHLRSVDRTAVVAFVVSFTIYLLTLAPTVYNLDSAELTTAAATGGIVRATGYPFYLVLGRIWALLPVGDVGYRLNLLSAFCGALTVFEGALILRRLDVNRWATWASLGLLASAPYFWAMSLIAEVYTLHTALLGGVLLVLLAWSDRPDPAGLFWPALLLTVSLGNHAATVLLLPGVAWFALATAPGLLRRRQTWLYVATAVALGSTVFLYLPLRYAANPAFNYAGRFDATGAFQPVNLQRWDGLVWLLTGRSFASSIFGYRWTELGGQISHFVQQLWQAFFAVGTVPALLGLVGLLRRERRTAVMLLLIFAAHTVFYVNYRVIDKDTMFLPAYFIWAIWLGAGYQDVAGWLAPGASARTRSERWLRRLTYGLLLAVVVVAVGRNWSLVDLSADYSTREQSEAIFAIVEPDAVIFGWWDTVPGLQYLQMVEGQRPDVLLINRFLISGEDMEQFIRREGGRRPIYINNPPLHLVQTMAISRVGPIYRLEPLPIPRPTNLGDTK